MTFSALLLRNLPETAIMEEHSTGEILDMCSWVTVIHVWLQNKLSLISSEVRAVSLPPTEGTEALISS